MMDRVKKIIFSLIESLIRDISGPVGRKIRYLYYKHRFAQCGRNVIIDEGVIFENPEKMYLGNNVWIDKCCILIAGERSIPNKYVTVKVNRSYKFREGELHIGSNVHIGPQCIIQAHGGVSIGDYFTASAGSKIYSLSNDVKKCRHGTNTTKEKYYILSPIVIKENVWIGLNSIVLGGTIEKDSFIAPNTVVLGNIEENSFVAGSPGRRVKNRF